MSAINFREKSLTKFKITIILPKKFGSKGFVTAVKNKLREKSRECHNYKPQPFPDTKRKRKPTNPNKHKSNKRTKST